MNASDKKRWRGWTVLHNEELGFEAYNSFILQELTWEVLYTVACRPVSRHDIQTIVRQSPMATIEGLLEAVFSFGSAPRLYNQDTSRVAGSSVE